MKTPVGHFGSLSYHRSQLSLFIHLCTYFYYYKAHALKKYKPFLVVIENRLISCKGIIFKLNFKNQILNREVHRFVKPQTKKENTVSL